ncbi:hypothetical protein L218DRAFT_1009450 [Marasmius fiardii PR-910]|nr:hypothetical protein L218DRAFT_1009450 [Marasmius fiardii PR-910]
MKGEVYAGKLGDQRTITSLIIAVEEVIGVVRYDDPPDADDRNYYQFLLAANAPPATLAKNVVYKYDNYRDKLETTEWLWHQFCAATAGDAPELKTLRVSRNLSIQKPQGKTGNLYTKPVDDDDSPAKKKQRTETSKPSRSRPGPGRSKSRSKSKPTAGPSRSGLRSTTQSTAGSSRYNLRPGPGVLRRISIRRR